jgi:hypothetical protein
VFDFLDKIANAGAGNRMSAEMHATARAQSKTTNDRNQLAQTAAGFGVSRAAKRAAQAQLVNEVGQVQAEALVKQAVHKVRTSFAK